MKTVCHIAIIFIFNIKKVSHVEGRPLKRRKIEETQLAENFEAAHDDIPYFDVDVGMGIDFGGDDFFFLFQG